MSADAAVYYTGLRREGEVLPTFLLGDPETLVYPDDHMSADRLTTLPSSLVRDRFRRVLDSVVPFVMDADDQYPRVANGNLEAHNEVLIDKIGASVLAPLRRVDRRTGITRLVTVEAVSRDEVEALIPRLTAEQQGRISQPESGRPVFMLLAGRVVVHGARKVTPEGWPYRELSSQAMAVIYRNTTYQSRIPNPHLVVLPTLRPPGSRIGNR